MLLRKYENIKIVDNGYLIHGDAADVMIVFMTDDVIRIRVHFDRKYPYARELLYASYDRMARSHGRVAQG